MIGGISPRDLRPIPHRRALLPLQEIRPREKPLVLRKMANSKYKKEDVS